MLKKFHKVFLGFLCFLLVGMIGIVDYLTGYELAFSLFYLVPISLGVWFFGRDYSLLISIFSATIWYLADIANGHLYSNPLIYLWNTAIRLGFFIIVAFLLAALRQALERERVLSRTDHLTGAGNSRSFLEIAQSEIHRFERYQHPFTVVYIDLDDFKKVNDRFGHSIGDEVLRVFVAEIRKQLRKTDIVSRLGGDEFALLLPETEQEAGRVVVEKIRAGLQDITKRKNWPVTISMGVVIYKATPRTADDLIRMADELMYSVKVHGKNGVGYSVFEG
jgi:diguanylate cyclase (GGDEF)-like protein